uniref:Uncharacterized protein n=1 Tax=Mycena chlorophos TaxID=658473 RepID=A0ABQ0LRN1_MYCCL|nr:predicted protein [Mycena chlorophos]
MHVDEAWVREQEGLALESLAPVDVVEIPVLPQLASKNLNQYFWLSFRERLQETNASALAKKCLEIVVRQLPAFPEQTTCYPPDENMSGPDNLVKIARTCVESDSHDQLPLIFTKMRLAVKTRSAPETSARYYYALADLLISLGEESIPGSRLPRAFLEVFFLEALDALIWEKQTQNCQCFVVFRRVSQTKSDTCLLNDENTTKILRVTAALGGVHFLRYIPGFDAAALKKHDRAVVTDFARVLSLNAKPENVDDPAYASYDSVVGFLLNVYPPAAGDLLSIVEFLKLALELKAYHTFKTRLLSLSTTAIDFLLRIVPRLLELLRPCRPTPLDQELDAFAHSVFKSFADKLHRFRTRDFATLAGFGCERGAKCLHGCSGLRYWLLGGSDIMDDEKYEVMRKKDSESREHLEQTLGQLRDR